MFADQVFGPTSLVALRSTTAWTVLTFRWAEECNFGFDKWRCRSWSEEKTKCKRLSAHQEPWKQESGRRKDRTLFQLLLLSGRTQLFRPERGQEKLLHKSLSGQKTSGGFFIRQSRLNNTFLFPPTSIQAKGWRSNSSFHFTVPQRSTSGSFCTDAFPLSLQYEQLMKSAEWTFREEVKCSPWFSLSGSDLFFIPSDIFSDRQVGVCVSCWGLWAHTHPPLFRYDGRVAAETQTDTWKTHTCQTTALNR